MTIMMGSMVTGRQVCSGAVTERLLPETTATRQRERGVGLIRPLTIPSNKATPLNLS